ncbi:MAG: protein kinase [Nitrososphaera sp.]|nr:protein kinase [Nitrososphaera sp.]MCI0692010.1 protein kinase [candidate division KSB1 bacterium]
MIGKTISHYKILEKLGGGGMGVVYKAEDTKLKRLVALKFLPPDLTRDEEAKERFIHEAQAASALDHPNICVIHEIDETEDGQIFICMAYYEGETLKKKIERGPLSIDQTLDLAIQIAQGLAKAHEKEIIHRDIKPANVFVTNDGIVKIVDFGLAKFAGQSRLTKTGTTLGTIAYMSPEQARGEEVDHRTDIWALGVVLYEMLTGQLPFRGEYDQAVMYEIVNEDPKPATSLRPEVPATLAQIIDRALSKEPEARHASATDLLNDLKMILGSLRPIDAEEVPRAVSLSRLLRQPRFAVPGIILLSALVTLAFWWFNYSANVRWARQKALPEIEQLMEKMLWNGEGPYAWAAYELATKAERYIPDDPWLNRLWPRFSRYVKIYSESPGARVYAMPYAAVDTDWRYVGESPISLRFPIGFSRVKLEKEGFRAVYDLVWNAGFLGDTLNYMLPEAGSLAEDMELLPEASNWYHIPTARAGLHLPGLEHLKDEQISDFLMDRYEVTNKAYKRFVDAGGYQDPKYWKYPFVKDGRTLSWEEVMALFKDNTGKPGPATWEVGDYPDGQDDYPVAGVSWYEAAAYAEFVGKSLPAIYHWDRAAFTWASPAIVPLSNLTTTGPLPVGSSRSMNRFGIYDLAGNVREWCFNENSRGGRFILGGGWNDPTYAFNDAYAQSPFDRSMTNGFRCIKYLKSDESRANLEKTIRMPFRDFLSEEPVSDETFALFLKQYAYDKTDLNAVVESVKEEEDWIREKITFDAAYGNERMMAYLFIPKHRTPPYQTVIHFPGSEALHTRSSNQLQGPSPILKSGRAFMDPIYKSTFERGDDLNSDYPNKTNFWKEHVIMWGKDLSRSIDYLETREDIDTDKLAYWGGSWGGAMGAIMLAVERRFKTSVLIVAGLNFQRSLPEVEAVHYLPRITTPVLMLNGKYDYLFPYETSQLPFYELLGTPKEHKKLFAYEGGHSVPKTQLIKETLAWLDRYLGPVESFAGR